MAVACVTRRYPLSSGCARLANHQWVHRAAGAGRGDVWAHVPGGQVLASLDDYIGRAAFFVGDLDRKITTLCRRIIRPGDTALDIGANIGLVTLLMSRLVGGAGRVHAFDPNPRMQTALSMMIERNGLANVSLHPFALGAEAGELELCIPQGNAGSASLVRRYEHLGFERCMVPVRTLSSVLDAAGVDKIRMIKIDVEGFEAEVLRGAESLLSRRVPDAVLFEFNVSTASSLREEPLFRLLDESGYGFFAIPASLFKTRVLRFDHRHGGALPGHDLLAAPRGPRYEELAVRLGATG